MNDYCIRNNEGVMVARISDRVYKLIVIGVSGHFRNRTTKHGTKTVYQVDEDYSFEPFNGIKIFVWKGYILESY